MEYIGAWQYRDNKRKVRNEITWSQKGHAFKEGSAFVKLHPVLKLQSSTKMGNIFSKGTVKYKHSHSIASQLFIDKEKLDLSRKLVCQDVAYFSCIPGWSACPPKRMHTGMLPEHSITLLAYQKNTAFKTNSLNNIFPLFWNIHLYSCLCLHKCECTGLDHLAWGSLRPSSPVQMQPSIWIKLIQVSLANVRLLPKDYLLFVLLFLVGGCIIYLFVLGWASEIQPMDWFWGLS